MFPRGTWRWEAVSSQGVILRRDLGIRIADLRDVQLREFRLRASHPMPISLVRDGSVADADVGVELNRMGILIRPASSATDLRFTRRNLGSLGSNPTHEEILFRFTWAPNGKRILVHLRNAQAFVMEERG